MFQKFIDLFRLNQLIKDFWFNTQLNSNAQRINQGKILSNQNKNHWAKIKTNIQLAEFSVFSQFGDDGILDFLIDYLEIQDKTFIEFGVERYTECNTRFILMNRNWSGLIIEGNLKYVKAIKKEVIYWKHDLRVCHKFITKENINPIISENFYTGNIGVLSIDIDGNDYWVWDAIHCVSPAIVIIEYNAVFGSNPWVVPYRENFNRTKAHFSNLFFGASLKSLTDLAQSKGYSLIGCNSAGNDAYFVRNDCLKDLPVFKDHKLAFVSSKIRESRSKSGDLSLLSGDDRLKAIHGCEVYNTLTNTLEYIQ